MMNGSRTFLFGLVALGVGPFADAQGPAAPSNIEKTPTAAAADKAATTFDGTLFFTPLQRREMERDRKQGNSISPNSQPDEARTVINGFARRSDGRLTVWIDGRPRWESATSRHLSDLSSADVGAPIGSISRVDSEDVAQPAPPVKIKKASKRSAKQAKK